ncbi:MAG: transglutaminase-like domain-containing protein [bacterium]
MAKSKFITFIWILFLFIFISPSYLFAKDFRTNYNVKYFLDSRQNKIETEVKYNINVTNLKEGHYVSKFTLSFPTSFKIESLKANDDVGVVTPNINHQQDSINIELSFNNPNKGLGQQNNFYLTFKQQNLFNINGNVWEVILPVIEKDSDENYQIEVNLPAGSDKKISISKPSPDFINKNVITWTNPNTKTIYAVFGNSQLYDLNLTYNLYNPKITNGYTDIALPPDLVNQKIIIKSIDPLPEKTYTDEDGNFLARYILKPRENKIIKFSAIAQISSEPRENVRLNDIKLLENKKRYLLNESSFWKIDNVDKYSNLKTPRDIYNFITANFKYDYDRVSKDIKRLGADYALKNPTSSVCTEFSDTFVALAREKGIFSREIQGYGFSDSHELRPLSLVTDILHSWPQYWDPNRNLWISIDPTWENTSGIDYFSSFDLNHIVFVIHGKQPEYPLPAGMYKINDTKDVSIKPTSENIIENINLNIISNVPDKINKNKIFKSVLKIKNSSNVFLYSVPIEIKARNINSNISKNNINKLAPYEEVDIIFTLDPTKSNFNKTQLSITVNNKTVFNKLVQLKKSYIVVYIILIILSTILFFFIIKKIKNKQYDNI